jgi:putative sterol carrier protein
MNGGVARLVYEQIAGTVGFVLAKRAQASEGQTVVFEVGSPGETFAYGVTGGRGTKLEQIPAEPTVRVSMDGEAYLRLGTGRLTPDEAEKSGRLRITGDRDFAVRILSGMNFTP